MSKNNLGDLIWLPIIIEEGRWHRIEIIRYILSTSVLRKLSHVQKNRSWAHQIVHSVSVISNLLRLCANTEPQISLKWRVSWNRWSWQMSVPQTENHFKSTHNIIWNILAFEGILLFSYICWHGGKLFRLNDAYSYNKILIYLIHYFLNT